MKQVVLSMAGAIMLALTGATAAAAVPELIIKGTINDQYQIVCIRDCGPGAWILQCASSAQGPWRDTAVLTEDKPCQIPTRSAPKYVRLCSKEENGDAVECYPAVPKLHIKRSKDCKVYCIYARIWDCKLWVLQGANRPEGPWKDLTSLRNEEPFQILAKTAPKYVRVWSPKKVGRAIELAATVPELVIRCSEDGRVLTICALICDGECWELEGSDCRNGPWTCLTTFRGKGCYEVPVCDAPGYVRLRKDQTCAQPTRLVLVVPELSLRWIGTVRNPILRVCADMCEDECWILQGGSGPHGPWKDLCTLRDSEPFQMLAPQTPKYLRLWTEEGCGEPVCVPPPGGRN